MVIACSTFAAFQTLAKHYDLHPLAIEDVINFQRIKCVSYPGHMYIATHTWQLQKIKGLSSTEAVIPTAAAQDKQTKAKQLKKPKKPQPRTAAAAAEGSAPGRQQQKQQQYLWESAQETASSAPAGAAPAGAAAGAAAADISGAQAAGMALPEEQQQGDEWRVFLGPQLGTMSPATTLAALSTKEEDEQLAAGLLDADTDDILSSCSSSSDEHDR